MQLSGTFLVDATGPQKLPYYSIDLCRTFFTANALQTKAAH